MLARARDLLAVVGCADAALLIDGDAALVDPAHPWLYAIRTSAACHRSGAARTASAPSGLGRTADGHAVALLANIGGPGDVPPAVAAHAEGVGLYRTELLFLDAEAAPGHHAQVWAYERV